MPRSLNYSRKLAQQQQRHLVFAGTLFASLATSSGLAQQQASQIPRDPQARYQELEELRSQARTLPINNLLDLARDALRSGQGQVPARVVHAELRRRLLAGDDPQPVLEIVTRNSESESLRAFVIRTLRPHVASLAPADQRNLWADLTRLGVDPLGASAALRVPAILCANDLSVVGAQTGVLARDEIEHHCRQLDRIMMDVAEDQDIRRAAIEGVALLQYATAIPQLLTLLTQEEPARKPLLTRTVSIALADLGAAEAVEPLGRLLRSTSDPGIFASAACALGDLGTKDALQSLVANAGRYDDGSCAVAISRQKRLILSLLRKDSPYLLPAIRATQYLYKEEDRKAYKAKLLELLPRLADNEQIAEALIRLNAVASKPECASIVELVPRRSGYAEEWDTIHRRSIAVRLEPMQTSVPTDEN